MTVSALAIHDEVWPILDAVEGVNAYDGEVPKNPPADEDGRVYAYAVLYMFPGRPAGLTLDATQSSLFAGFQVTCVGGDPTVALWCLDKVRTALVGAFITVDGREHQVTSSEFDPGNVRRDDNVTPPRHFVPDRYDVFIP